MSKNRIVIGLMAHVDSGKTTLAESLLYMSGTIRKLGRVDHKDTFLDTHELERNRGITIFSKQARMQLQNFEITLLDTPGHVDFSAEMERTIQVLDYAILLVSGTDGVQGHTLTLWKLLKRYHIPTFIFVNKMDLPGADVNLILEILQTKLDERCVNFTVNRQEEAFFDTVAMCSEALMEEYLENGDISLQNLQEAICDRAIYPCFFGSALKQEGIVEFMDSLNLYMRNREYSEEFGARVYKISRDGHGNRLTHMKITGGSLKVKEILESETKSGERWSEKVDQIRLYSGNQFVTTNEAAAGSIVAVSGLTKTYAGEGLGKEILSEIPLLEPVLTYRILLPQEANVHSVYTKLCQLLEEEPELNIIYDETLKEIHAQVMGEVQIEILKSMITERFQLEVEFDAGNIVYKETIEEPIVGIGHFEPLRHYAEVHLLMEPLEQGCGLEFAVSCSEDVLDKNWQRLIMTHLEEKKHKGVLTGSEITDMRITIIAGRAHLKHTEGGDFRQATYRAIRQGLKSARSILLEPIYEFRLELPQEMIGRAMSDIQRMHGSFDAPNIQGEKAILTGVAPVATMRDYQRDVISYSRGHGSLFCEIKGYAPCHNTEEIIDKYHYDSESDFENPTGSVFCSHGAGFVVPWYQVREYAHVDNGIKEEQEVEETPLIKQRRNYVLGVEAATQEELDMIFERTYGSIKQKRVGWSKTITASNESSYRGTEQSYEMRKSKEEYLLVDGYNIIFAWDDLNELAKMNIDSARDKLLDIMCNYQGIRKNHIIVVFDAYKVTGGKGSIQDYHNIHVVYTKEAETADQYIEKVTHELGRKHNVTVATSDGLEQMIIWGQGARRLSAKGLNEEVKSADKQIKEQIDSMKSKEKVYMKDYMPDL